MPDEPRTPDALYLPRVMHADPMVRAATVTAQARVLLKMPDGPPPVISPYEQRDGKLTHFVRRTIDDSMLFPTGHPRSGEVRHEWVDGPEGVRLGYLKGD